MTASRPRFIQAAVFILICGVMVIAWIHSDKLFYFVTYTDPKELRMKHQPKERNLNAWRKKIDECAVDAILCGDKIADNNGKLPDINTLKSTFHSLMTSIDFQCPTMQRFGKEGDGGYEACMTKAVRPKPYSCLVYSFGVSGDWSFDEAFAKYGCEVHSFDPSIGKGDHMHAPNISFHNLGLWGRQYVDSHGWKLENFSTIRKKLGHENRIIDALKVDVEGAEWPFLRDVIFSDPLGLSMVKQLFIELHTPRFRPGVVTAVDFSEIITYTKRLREDLGFMLYRNVQRNNCCGRFSDLMPAGIPEKCCHELFFFNANPFET